MQNLHSFINGEIMRLPYKISEAGSRLYRAGVSYYAFGIAKQNGAALFDYFTLSEPLTEAQAQAVRDYCPDFQIGGSRSQYAPEIKRQVLLFPKAAWYRNQRGQA